MKRLLLFIFLMQPIYAMAQDTDDHVKAMKEISVNEGYFGYDLYYPDSSGKFILATSIAPTNTDKTKLMHCFYSMDNKYYNMNFVAGGLSYELTLGYDKFRKKYVLVSLDNGPALIDVYQGNVGSEGNLIVDNLGSGTHYLDNSGIKHHNRLSFIDMNADSFILLIEDSIDTGKSWVVQAKYLFKNEKNM